jgi:hypothetical protein
MKPFVSKTLIGLSLILVTTTLKAQDVIVKLSGSVVNAHVRKVKDNNAIYWKHFRRIKLPTSKIAYIKYGDGTKTTFNDVTKIKGYKNYSQIAKNNPPSIPDSLKQKLASMQTGHKYYIERFGNSFRLDTNDIVNTSQVNQLMAQSPNPMVAINLKAAKTMRFFATLTKIMAFPGSVSGGFASYNTFTTLFNQMHSGTASFKSYLGAGLSFMGTLSLPITTGILKHIQKKLYDKTLTMYSAGN